MTSVYETALFTVQFYSHLHDLMEGRNSRFRVLILVLEDGKKDGSNLAGKNGAKLAESLDGLKNKLKNNGMNRKIDGMS